MKARWLRNTTETITSHDDQVNWALILGTAIMALVVIAIILALIVGWADGSLEGFDGLLSHFRPNPG